MQKNKYLIYSFILLFSSCARITSLNLKKHQYGTQPRKIIWIQIAGLDDQISSLFKFENQKSEMAFENFTCYGRAWGYNLFKLRPDSFDAFHSEITGKKNVKGNCEDFDQKPIWHFLSESGYSTSILENPIKSSNSLLKAKTCKKEGFLQNATVFTMQKTDTDASYFHSHGEFKENSSGVFYDRSCQKNKCFSQWEDNSISIFENYFIKKNKYLFLIRDFSFEQNLENNNVSKLYEKLNSLNKLILYFQNRQKTDPEMLVMVTSGSPIGVDLPSAGKAWRDMISTNQSLIYKNRLVNSPVFVLGARSENFCGSYEQSEMLIRLLSGPKEQGLEYRFFNPLW